MPETNIYIIGRPSTCTCNLVLSAQRLSAKN